MKVRLQDIVEYCINKEHCTGCHYCKSGECIAKIDGYYPFDLEEYYQLCYDSPELAKALYTNKEIELHENDSKRID
jgi:hypothetical protein